MKLLLEGPLGEKKGLTPSEFATALNNEVKGSGFNSTNATVAWYATHNTRWVLGLISILVFIADESPIIPGISLSLVVWVAANRYHLLLCLGAVLMVLCATPDTAQPIVVKIRVTVTLQNEQCKILFQFDESPGLSVKSYVTTQLITIIHRVNK
jgi:hypothetical protein